ncbi:DUF6807 family protein [Tuwongella immobilis]|uniref:Methane oxygenase PmoA n=1 Tax=Tuwongella immobilis TaxID=692036 RepID=A0A6C2YNK5_9BACT|nr:DUF6807 family protein [Tuwongella immobilis]VIP02472.1 Uncharacterized protein OS=Pirellula staleyi (strain ATCC 27377 / DSM 6068 / ICPB 4128) GN=Psta_0765 PE=4 SV=1: PmoA [Tuwongella immobilis]VTS01502.1 Uncharacterized protein OS=Pirellula staleyi (strain ATCC 27377 / DSM 6068 / ICPB 4128) GN=Psta_0765 PE=4 SV=1: PmoA [Tuwongella immobilis]
MYRFLRATLSLLTLVAIPMTATAAPTLSIAVEASATARQHLPLSVDLTPFASQLPKLESASVTVSDNNGTTMPAQIVKQFQLDSKPDGNDTPRFTLFFWVTELPANTPLKLTASFGPAKASDDAFKVVESAGQFSEIQRGGKPFLRFMNAGYDPSTKDSLFQTYKVYHHLFADDGKQLLTNGPAGKFPHHRGIFFGFNRVSYNGKSADVWHCTKGAHQRFTSFLNQSGGPLLGQQVAKIDWVGQDGKPFAQEVRELLAFSTSKGTLIEFRSTVRTKESKVRLDGDPQHAGFHFRANSEVEAHPKTTYFVRPSGKGKMGEELNWIPASKQGPKNLPWNAMSYEVGSKRYTTVYLDRPNNPKEARISERAYGRFGNYFEYDLTPDNPLQVAYRLWIQPGEVTVDDCQALSADFVSPPKVTATLNSPK